MYVLLIDDNIPTLKSLETLFNAIGHKCKITDDPETGIDLFKNEKFDLVLTDYNMPGINGIEVLQKIQKYNPDSIIILISGHDDNRHYSKLAKKHGAFGYLKKPIVIAELLNYLIKIDKLVSKADS